MSTTLTLGFFSQKDSEGNQKMPITAEDFIKLGLAFVTNKAFMKPSHFSMKTALVRQSDNWLTAYILEVFYYSDWNGPLDCEPKEFLQGLGIADEKLSDNIGYGGMARLLNCFLEVYEYCPEGESASRRIYGPNGKAVLKDSELFDMSDSDISVGSIDDRELIDIVIDKLNGREWLEKYGLKPEEEKKEEEVKAK